MDENISAISAVFVPVRTGPGPKDFRLVAVEQVGPVACQFSSFPTEAANDEPPPSPARA